MDIARVRARGCANGRIGKEKELNWIPKKNYGEEKEVKERKRGEKSALWKKESRKYFLQLECARCGFRRARTCAYSFYLIISHVTARIQHVP